MHRYADRSASFSYSPMRVKAVTTDCVDKAYGFIEVPVEAAEAAFRRGMSAEPASRLRVLASFLARARRLLPVSRETSAFPLLPVYPREGFCAPLNPQRTSPARIRKASSPILPSLTTRPASRHFPRYGA